MGGVWASGAGRWRWSPAGGSAQALATSVPGTHSRMTEMLALSPQASLPRAL